MQILAVCLLLVLAQTAAAYLKDHHEKTPLLGLLAHSVNRNLVQENRQQTTDFNQTVIKASKQGNRNTKRLEMKFRTKRELAFGVLKEFARVASPVASQWSAKTSSPSTRSSQSTSSNHKHSQSSANIYRPSIPNLKLPSSISNAHQFLPSMSDSHSANSKPPTFKTTVTKSPINKISTTKLPVSKISATKSPTYKISTTKSSTYKMSTTKSPANKISNTKPPVNKLTEQKSLINKLTTRRPPIIKFTPLRPLINKFTTRRPLINKFTTRRPLISTFTIRQPPFIKFTTRRPLISTFTTRRLPNYKLTTRRPPISKFITNRPLFSIFSTRRPLSSRFTNQRPLFSIFTTRSPLARIFTTRRPLLSSFTTRQPLMSKLTTQKLFLIQFTARHPSISELTTWQPLFNVLTTENPPVNKLFTPNPPISKLTTQKPPINQLTIQKPPINQLTTQKPPINQLTTQKPSIRKLTTKKPPIHKITTQEQPTKNVTTLNLQPTDHSSTAFKTWTPTILAHLMPGLKSSGHESSTSIPDPSTARHQPEFLLPEPSSNTLANFEYPPDCASRDATTGENKNGLTQPKRRVKRCPSGAKRTHADDDQLYLHGRAKNFAKLEEVLKDGDVLTSSEDETTYNRDDFELQQEVRNWFGEKKDDWHQTADQLNKYDDMAQKFKDSDFSSVGTDGTEPDLPESKNQILLDSVGGGPLMEKHRVSYWQSEFKGKDGESLVRLEKIRVDLALLEGHDTNPSQPVKTAIGLPSLPPRSATGKYISRKDIPENYGYHAGHVIPAALHGPNDKSWNFFPQNPVFNGKGGWADIELKVQQFYKKKLESHRVPDDFRIRQTMIFDYGNNNKTPVPRGFMVKFEQVWKVHGVEVIVGGVDGVKNGYYINPGPTRRPKL